MNCSWSDETLPNYIKTKRPIQKGNGRNNKKKPMSNQKTTPKNTNKTNWGHKKKQCGLTKGYQKNNLCPKALTCYMKPIK